MPEISISAEQHEYLDRLRAELEERFVGEYGTVRHRDALQFLIDRREDGGDDPVTTTTNGESGTTRTEDVDAGDGGEGGASGDGADRLQAMMNLLDTHDDKWETSDADDEKYVVTLPDGETERARTKDDVRALLFRHYR